MFRAFYMGDGAEMVREAEARYPADIEPCAPLSRSELLAAYASPLATTQGQTGAASLSLSHV